MSLVSVEELRRYMSGINITSPQENAAQQILDGVQGHLEMYLNRKLEPTAVREQGTADVGGVVYLAQSPVSKILKVSLLTQYTMLPAQEVLNTWTPGAGYEGSTYQKYDYVPDNNGTDLIVPGGVYLGIPGANYVIEYEAGNVDFTAPYLPALKTGILRVASREFQQMNDDTVSLRNGAATPPVDPVPVTTRGWEDAELAQFDRLRRRVIV